MGFQKTNILSTVIFSHPKETEFLLFLLIPLGGGKQFWVLVVLTTDHHLERRGLYAHLKDMQYRTCDCRLLLLFVSHLSSVPIAPSFSQHLIRSPKLNKSSPRCWFVVKTSDFKFQNLLAHKGIQNVQTA